MKKNLPTALFIFLLISCSNNSSKNTNNDSAFSTSNAPNADTAKPSAIPVEPGHTPPGDTSTSVSKIGQNTAIGADTSYKKNR